MAKLNKQGKLIMRFAAAKLGCITIPELAEKTGIPYHRLYRRLVKDFGGTTADEMRALVKAIRLKGDELEEIWR